jgi:hypothetical protein
MPNYCENELIVSGNKDLIELFKEMAKSQKDCDKKDGVKVDFSLDSFVPYPHCYKIETLEKKHKMDGFNGYGIRNKEQLQSGYDWNIENWGTKWDCIEPKLVKQTDKGSKSALLYNFDTAWSPPRQALLKIAKIFPGLKFKLSYWECGAGFNGVTTYNKGELIKDSYNDDYKGRRGG